MRAVLSLLLAGIALGSGCLSTSAPVERLGSNVLPGLPAGEDFYPPVATLRTSILEALASGGAVTVPASLVDDGIPGGLAEGLWPPRDVEILLRPSKLMTSATWAEVDGERVQLPWFEVYEGVVKDDETDLVRLVVTKEWIAGVIHRQSGDKQGAVGALGQALFAETWQIRIGLNGNVPDGAVAALGLATPTATGQSPPVSFDRDGVVPEDCLLLVPPYAKPMTELGQAKDEPLTARIVLDADAAFAKALGNDTFPMMVAMLQEVDAIYAYEVGIRFEIVGLHVNTDGKYYPKPEDEAPLDKLAQYWNARKDVERDIVHIFTGQPSNYAMANCIGGAGQPELAYTFTPLGWWMNFTAFHTQAFAHELGHIFSAHHHYGNHVETTGNGATIMIQGYTPGIRPVFSTMEKSVIRGWAEQYLGKDAGARSAGKEALSHAPLLHGL